MRRFLCGWIIAAVVSAIASVAVAGNQEVAEQIAQSLRASGKMHDYKIGVKYQEGTVWLVGRVASEQQRTTALNLVMQSPNVNHVVNNLSVSTPDTDQTAASSGSQVRFGSVHDATYESESPSGPKLSHPSGLSAAERLQRTIRGTRPQPATGETTLDTVNQVERVPASFEPALAQRTSVTEPTLAEPTLAPPMDSQPVPRRPLPLAYTQQPNAAMAAPPAMAPGAPRPMYTASAAGGVAPARYDQPYMPNYAWPSYAAYPNYAAVTYPKQYSPTAWPYIGPFYPYPQVPLGWRKVTLEWDDGWWMLDFKDR